MRNMNKSSKLFQDVKTFGLFGLGVKIVSEGRMSNEEEISHMYTPCPICGKINDYRYSKSSLIPNIETYVYSCEDSSYLLRITDREVNRHLESGCGAQYKIKINKNKELVKSNLQLNKKEMRILTNSTPNKSVDEIKDAQEKQRSYWVEKYDKLGIR